MTKKLEEIFNMEEKAKAETEVVEEKVVEQHQQIKSLKDSDLQIQKIAGDLPQIRELDQLGEKELDHLADKAEQAYDDLMDLGMNVEVRYSGRIFEVAGSMLKNAIDAKTAKVDKKLKAVDLQLKNLKLDQD
mgnify:CR=1 FL=1